MTRHAVKALRTVRYNSGRSEVKKKKKKNINSGQFLAQTNRFISLDLNVLPRGFNLVLSVYVFFDSQSHESH